MLNLNNAVVYNTTVIALNDTGAKGIFYLNTLNFFAHNEKKYTHLKLYSAATLVSNTQICCVPVTNTSLLCVFFLPHKNVK